MDFSPLNALSPLDGRYQPKTKQLAVLFSEAGLIKHRVKIELEYLKFLSQKKVIRSFTDEEQKFLAQLTDLSSNDIKQVKQIERETHHDVKAVEYFLKNNLDSTTLKDCIPFLHFGLTSADVNNLAYRLMIRQAHNQLLIPKLLSVLNQLKSISSKYKDLAILARTHGQSALPTTYGKEVSVFAIRLLGQLKKLVQFKLTGKLNGAVGSFQALQFAYPDVNWINFSNDFVSSLSLKPNLHTTQINPADNLIELFHHYHLLNSVLIDLSQDFWRYISDGWLVQDKSQKQVGSSTMPQKVNPIRFENCEGNLTLANGLIETMARKLPISRLQRDLSDSTVNRNIGLIFGYMLIGCKSLAKGLTTIEPNKKQINQDLNHNYNILAEALQTTLRKNQDHEAYQKTAQITKNKIISKKDWQQLVKSISPQLQRLSPDSYTGIASELTTAAVAEIDEFLSKKY